MKNQDRLTDFVKNRLGQAEARVILKPLHLLMDKNSDGVLFLSQLVYWSDRSTVNNDGWFYKSHADWENEIFMSIHKVTKWSKFLEDKGVLERKVKQVHGNKPTLHYRVNMERLLEWVEEEYRLLPLEEEIEEQTEEINPYEQFCESYKAVRNAPELIKVISFEFFRRTGFEPTSNSRTWKKSIMELWDAADRKMPNFIEGLKQAEEARRNSGLTFSGPKSYLKFMQNQVSLGNKGGTANKKQSQEYELIDGLRVYTVR